ncbi:MAG: amidohydrolase family protein [Candidatus Bathyarchaeia archaeon]
MSTVFLRGHVFTGDNFIENGCVVVDQSKGVITHVGPEGEVKEPKDARRIEVEGSTILPGLIDAHMHFFGSKKYDIIEWLTTPETLVALRSVADARKLLRAGYTAVRELGGKAGPYLRRAVEEGMIEGPTIVQAAKSLSQTGGNDDVPILPLEISDQLSYSYYCDGPWECRKAVRKVVRDGGDLVKVYASGSMSQGTNIRPQFTPEELKAIVDEATSVGMKVAAHAYGEEALTNSVKAGVHSIEHGIGLTPEIAQEMQKRGVFYIPTLSAYMAMKATTEQHVTLTQRHLTEDLDLAKKFKLKIVAGSDYIGCDTEPHGQNYLEIVNLAKYIGNREALIAATSRAADCLGLENSGWIKAGYEADLVVARGNPIEDPKNLAPDHILHVIRRGQVHTVYG